VALILAALLAVLAPPVGRSVLWRKELNPVLRGQLLAEEQGCFSCHRSFSSAEIPNPGSRWGSVPRFAAGNARMYAETREEIEEFIRFGAPLSWLEDAAVSARLAEQRVRMPAYGEILSDGEIGHLVAFTSAVERVGDVDGEAARRGRELARSNGCFGCHGVDGAGGLPNPGSLGGFTPGFLGANFPDLVQDEDEFREWVLEGTSKRLAANPVIAYFWRRQRIAMPAYRNQLSGEEVGDIWAWVEAARESVH
jgi:mono/diheme cytochrome c family protein